jgi:aminoglycoside phosphotransferase family enzyme
VHYSFLDFSTLQKRQYYCHREVELNKRLAPQVYIDVWPVRKTLSSIKLGGESGSIVDYAVRMRKLDGNQQMDVLLRRNAVTSHSLSALASMIAEFHKSAAIISDTDGLSIQVKFNDLAMERDFLKETLGVDCINWINDTIRASDEFIDKYKLVIKRRVQSGFFRDGHGDLHARNIFLQPEPVIFDCIEFNDEYRQIDVLNEVAFLCMDLDNFERQDLSDQFIHIYNQFFPSMITEDDRKLFMYYKCYRANVRAKVNSLRAQSASDAEVRKKCLAETQRYLRLMRSYLPFFS